MKRMLVPGLVTMALAGCGTMDSQQAGGAGGGKEAKIAFDVTEGNPTAMILKVDTIELTRKQLIEAGVKPRIVVAFRGPASFYTTTDLAKVKEADRADALKIRAKLVALSKAEGVEGMEQCNVPLGTLKLKKEDVLPEVKVVPNGWIALVAHQDRGYRYIAP